MVLFTSGSSLTWGNLQVLCMASPPKVFTCYLFLTINFSHLYRDSMMSEFAFFASKEDRWRNNMRALWGNLSICPHLDHLELPYHTLGKLLSISHLKVWGNTQEPHNDMAYLLVCTEDASETESYGMALVWISPHQARASTMEEALGTLSACISSGPNWPYLVAQLYEGSNDTPLPKDKHLGILPQGKAEESPNGQISQLKVHQLLSTRPWVVYLVGLNGGNQSDYHQLTRTTA